MKKSLIALALLAAAGMAAWPAAAAQSPPTVACIGIAGDKTDASLEASVLSPAAAVDVAGKTEVAFASNQVLTPGVPRPGPVPALQVPREVARPGPTLQERWRAPPRN